MKISKSAQLGILIVFSIAILIWGLNYLKGNDLFKRYSTYHVYYNRVDGLEKSNKVTLNGYPIGKITNICFADDHSGRLIVSFSAEKSFEIPQNSVAKIVSDIMGTKSIEIHFSQSDVFYHSNDTLPGEIEGGLKQQISQQILPIKNKAEKLIESMDSVMSTITVILNKETSNNISTSFSNLNKTINNLEAITTDLQEVMESEKDNIKQTLSNLNNISSTFSNNSDEIETIIHNLNTFSDTLSNLAVSPALNNITLATKEISLILEKLNKDDNSAGLLFNDENLYFSIKNLSDNLASLTKDIQKNPKRYLQISAFDFGKNVYINTENDASQKEIVFKVFLTTSTQKLDTTNFNITGNIEEYYHKNSYQYFTGSESKYSEIETTYNSAKKYFPQAQIVAFKKGKMIKLEKALRKTK